MPSISSIAYSAYGSLSYTYSVNFRKVLLICILLSGCSASQLSSDNVHGVRVSVYENINDQLSFNEIQNQSFVSQATNNLKFGLSNSTFWVRVDVHELANRRLMLRNCYGPIDLLSIYINRDGTWSSETTGSNYVFASREVRHPCYVFNLSNSSENHFFIKAASDGAINIPVDVLEADTFWQWEQDTQLLRGAYIAFLGALFAYNFLLFLILRERAYLYYCGYLLGMNLFLGTMNGLTKMYLWPNATWWGGHAAVTCIAIAVACGMKFTSMLARAEDFAPLLYRVINAVAPLFVMVIAAQIYHGAFGTIALGIYVSLALVLITAAIVAGVYRSYPPAKVLLLTIVIMAPSAWIYYAQVLGMLKAGWLSDNILYITSALEALILSFALAYRIKILNQEVEQNQQFIIKTKSDFTRSLLQSVDNERRSIARELHDSIGQALLVAKHLVNRISSDEERRHTVAHIQNLITDTRNLARNMHPQQIDILGFETALQTMLSETLNPAGISTHFDITGAELKLSNEVLVHLYRIAQEFASNILKHSDASQVVCHLHQDQHYLTLSIQDNGIGMSKGVRTGLGLLNMRERAETIDADFKIVNNSGSGCRLELKVPLA